MWLLCRWISGSQCLKNANLFSSKRFFSWAKKSITVKWSSEFYCLDFAVFFINHHLLLYLGLRGFLKPFLSPAHSWLLCFVLASLLNVTLSLLLPSFRIRYSLNVADRLADEHVLIGLYVNMLRNNPPWLVQVWLLGCSLEEQSELVTSLSKGHGTCVTRRSQRHFSTLSGVFWDVSLNVGKVLRDQRIYVLIDIRSKGKT